MRCSFVRRAVGLLEPVPGSAHTWCTAPSSSGCLGHGRAERAGCMVTAGEPAGVHSWEKPWIPWETLSFHGPVCALAVLKRRGRVGRRSVCVSVYSWPCGAELRRGLGVPLRRFILPRAACIVCAPTPPGPNPSVVGTVFNHAHCPSRSSRSILAAVCALAAPRRRRRIGRVGAQLPGGQPREPRPGVLRITCVWSVLCSVSGSGGVATLVASCASARSPSKYTQRRARTEGNLRDATPEVRGNFREAPTAARPTPQGPSKGALVCNLSAHCFSLFLSFCTSAPRGKVQLCRRPMNNRLR